LEKPFALIVEDDRDIVALFRHVLDLAGYRTEIVLHGKVAAEHLANSTPDIVLLDLNLPGVSGGEILVRMHADERLKDIPVVVITSLDLDAKDRERLSSGVQSVLVKEMFQPADLINHIRQLVRRSMERRNSHGGAP